MKKETFKGEVSNAYGNQLPQPVKFSGEYDAYETRAEVEAAKDWPKDEEIVDFVNNKQKANARQKAMIEALTAAGITKPDPNDPNVALARMLKDLEKVELTPEQKEMMAAVLKAKAASK